MARPSPEVARARPADRETAADTLALAFATDPVMSWLVGSDRDAAPRLRHLFAHALGVELQRDEHLVDVAHGGRGVALWHEVDEWETGNAAMVRMVPTAVRTFGRRLPLALRVLSRIERVHPREPHRHLAFIGVHPSSQGNGHGGALLAAMTEELDERGTAAYLESSNRANEALYARHGFVAREPIALPPGAPQITPMWRDPR
jgi:ribosomal protein S18 acetylase RimI-like enzyme